MEYLDKVVAGKTNYLNMFIFSENRTHFPK
jgi:hypothetical protein